MLPNEFRIEREDASFAPVLKNLFEHYLYDMAEWFEYDSDEKATYDYPVARCWAGDGCVYVPYAGDIPIGFAIVSRAEAPVETDCRDMKEFFVVRRHRHGGVAQALAAHVWDRHPGPWLVRVFRGNRPAVPFWRKTVAAYTSGRYQEHEREAYDRLWSYFSFRSDRDGAGRGAP